MSYRFCPQCATALEARQTKPGDPARLTCPACEFIYYPDPKLAAGCIVEHEGGIVLVRRAIEPGYGKWVYPGGYVDRGETVPQAAQRETREEACLEVRVERLVGLYSYPGRTVIVAVYSGVVTGGTLAAADECLEARSFAPAAIPWRELAFPSTFEALRDYLQQAHGLLPPADARPPAFGAGSEQAHEHR
jgi:8-oxo-dGTP diphosphatase